MKVNHAIPGLPETVYTIAERNGKFFPKAHGQFLSALGGNRGSRIARFDSLEEAQNAVIEMIGRMQ